MKYKVHKGTSKCAACSKRIGNIVEIDGKHYGTDCAAELLGKNVTAPAWLYELSYEFANDQAEVMPTSDPYGWIADLQCNFWNQYGVWGGTDERPTVKVNGKRVTVDQREEINAYMQERYSELTGAKYCEHGGLLS